MLVVFYAQLEVSDVMLVTSTELLEDSAERGSA